MIKLIPTIPTDCTYFLSHHLRVELICYETFCCHNSQVVFRLFLAKNFEDTANFHQPQKIPIFYYMITI